MRRGGARAGGGRGWWPAVAVTVGVLLLMSTALSGSGIRYSATVIVTTGVLSLFFYRLYPGGGLFSLMVSNVIAVYSFFYVLTVEQSFPGASPIVSLIGFELPLAALLAGSWHHRREIGAMAEHGDERTRLTGTAPWLLPLVALFVAAHYLPRLGLTAAHDDAALLGSMAVVAGVVFVSSRRIAQFLVDGGTLFQDFFARAGRLVQPAFAFLSVYSLTVIVFGCVYRILDLYTGSPQFAIAGEARRITFVESVYFSIVTFSTVGYGDIIPASDLVRVVASLQIVAGILVIMFGLQAILTYVRRE